MSAVCSDVCVQAHVWAGAHVHIKVCICRPKGVMGCLLCLLSTFNTEDLFSGLGACLSCLSVQSSSSGVSYLCFPGTGITGRLPHLPGFHMDSRDLYSGPGWI